MKTTKQSIKKIPSTNTLKVKNLPVRKPTDKLKNIKLLNQKMISQEIWRHMKDKLQLNEIEAVLKLAQSIEIEYLKKGYRICKRDYLTIEPVIHEAKDWISPLDKKSYTIPRRVKLCVRIGDGLNKQLAESVSQKG